jgi:hypothetical protein
MNKGPICVYLLFPLVLALLPMKTGRPSAKLPETRRPGPAIEAMSGGQAPSQANAPHPAAPTADQGSLKSLPAPVLWDQPCESSAQSSDRSGVTTALLCGAAALLVAGGCAWVLRQRARHPASATRASAGTAFHR